MTDEPSRSDGNVDREGHGLEAVGPPREWPTGDWLAHRARSSPEATALIEADGGTAWSYAELDDAVAETAGRLASLGVGTGDHLGVLMETRVAFVRLVHAAARLGAVLLPLNVRLAQPELARQVEVVEPDLLVCEADTEAAAVAVASCPVASVDSPANGDAGADGDADTVAPLREQSATAFSPAEWSRSDVWAVLFTSGTTGDPKAVALTAGNLLASATASAFRLGVSPDDRWLLCLSTYHMGGLSVVLRSALYGTTVVLQEGFDDERAVRALREYGVTGVSLVPTMLRRMLDATDAGRLADSLRFVLLGGAPASDDLLAACEDRGVPVHPTYGTTETASQIATARPEEAFAHRGTVGRPLLWTDVTVVGEGADGDTNPLPAGEVGELVVSGPTVMKGYYADSEAAADAFGEYGFHTGDVGYRDEAGRLWVLNRREDRIVTGGENVHPGKVADALRDHPEVRDAAVVGLDDPEWGERVAALVVPEAGVTAGEDGDLSVADVDAHCRERLADYECPKTVAFADDLPRTASGTVERDAVRETLRDADGDGEE